MTDPLTPEHLAELRRLHAAYLAADPMRGAYARLASAAVAALPALLGELDLLRREKAEWSPGLLSIARQRNEIHELLDEVREVVDPKGWSSRYSSLRPAVEALKARASLPVLATCGGCGRCGTQAASDGRVDVCQHEALPSPRCTKRLGPPPSWCPLRGQR